MRNLNIKLRVLVKIVIIVAARSSGLSNAWGLRDMVRNKKDTDGKVVIQIDTSAKVDFEKKLKNDKSFENLCTAFKTTIPPKNICAYNKLQKAAMSFGCKVSNFHVGEFSEVLQGSNALSLNFFSEKFEQKISEIRNNINYLAPNSDSQNLFKNVLLQAIDSQTSEKIKIYREQAKKMQEINREHLIESCKNFMPQKAVPVIASQPKTTIYNFHNVTNNSALIDFVSKLDIKQEDKEYIYQQLEDLNSRKKELLDYEKLFLKTLSKNPGFTNKKLAKAMNYSERYTQDICRNIRKKMGFDAIEDDNIKRQLLVLFAIS